MPRSIFAPIAAAFALALASAAPTYALPEVKVGTGFLISPTDANTYYNAQGMTSPAWSEDPEINKLAAALGDDVDRIYEYVRNEIDVIPLFGVHAGARGCYIDKACTPFDQAEFMVELLRSAGYTAKYQLGTITLTGAQFNDWFGITNATAARKLLADGGAPATVSDNGATVTSVTMMHVWVIATISGTGYAFDPSFKSHTVTTGIDVAAAMGFNGAQFFADATQGATTATDNGTARVHSMNRAGVRSALTGYATTLLNFIASNHADSAIENIIGGRAVAPYIGGPLRQTSLPYQSSLLSQITGDLPVTLRTRVSMQVTGTLTLNWNLNDIYGKQIVYEFNEQNPLPPTPSQFRVLLGEQDATGWLNGTGGGGSVTINHPYAAGTIAGSVNGTYMDRTTGGAGATVGATQIIIATGRPSSDLAAWQERNHTGRQGFTYYWSGNDPEPATPYPQQIASRRRMATTLVMQLQDLAKLVAGIGNSELLVHDMVGIVSGTATFNAGPGPAATSFIVSVEPAISAISKTGDLSQSIKVARTFATMTSALEGSVVQQTADSAYPISAVAQLDWAHAGPTAGNRWYYHATSANWTWVKSQILTNYHAATNENISPMRDQAEGYINAGYTVLIPRSSSLGPAPEARERTCTIQGDVLGFNDYVQSFENQIWNSGLDAWSMGLLFNMVDRYQNSVLVKWELGLLPVCTYLDDPDRAGAFIAIHPTTGSVAHISSRANAMGKGGGGSTDIDTNPARLFSVSAAFKDKGMSARAGVHDVDLKSGTLEYSPGPDIVTGNGGYPYSLSFKRSYRSGLEDSDVYLSDEESQILSKSRDPIFGTGGWTSNIHHYASVTSSGTQIFGRDDPRAASQTLSTAQALLSLLADGGTALETLERQIAGAYAAAWWAETHALNTIMIDQGHEMRAFTKLADGAFVQRGSPETAELVGVRQLVTPPAHPHVLSYKTCIRITGAQREVSYYGVWDANYSTCVGEPDSRFTGDGQTMRFARQVFPYGVTVTWNESTRTLSNNVGRSLTFSAPVAYGSGTTVTDNAGRSAIVARSGSTVSVTDVLGHVWTYVETPSAFEVRLPSTPGVAFFRAEFANSAMGLGVVDRVKNALGNTNTYNIGGGRVSSVVDPLGNTVRATHDRFGNLIRAEDALGHLTKTDYDNHRRPVKATAPEGNFFTYSYDSRSNLLAEVETPKPGSPQQPRTVSTKTYDTLCNLVLSDTDALDRTTTWTINQTICKYLTATGPQAAGSPQSTFAYNSIGQLTQTTDPTGVITLANYDVSTGNLTSVVVDPGPAPHIAATTSLTYDTAGNIKTLTDPRGYEHTGDYDAMRRLIQHTAPSATGAITKWTYNVDGLVTKTEQATGSTSSPWAVAHFGYLPTAQTASVTDADGRVTRYTYDAASRLLLTIDAEARQTKFLYDPTGRVSEVRQGVGTSNEQAHVRFAFTPNGKRSWIKDPNSNQTAYQYDGFDRLERTTFPDATYETLSYNIVDTVASKRTRNNQLIVNTYDAMKRIVTHLVPQPNSAPAILASAVYDFAGRPTQVSDNTGNVLSYAFDSAKRIISVTQSAPTFSGTRVVGYQLDASGNKTRTTWADGYYVQYAYDGLNRVTTAIENGTFLLATYVHDPLGRRTSLVYGNGASQAYAYSAEGDLLTLASTLSGASNIYTNTFTKAHQIASESASSAGWSYTPTSFQTTNYSAPNNLNQFVNVTVGANPTSTIAYDANGNLTGDGTWAFAYDAENMLRSATNGGSASIHQYDPLGRRQALTENSVMTTFLHDGSEEIADYSSTSVLRRYVPGPGTDMPIAMVTPNGGGDARRYFHTNRQGSTISMSADDGTMVEGPYTYDAYGNGAPATGVPFKYTGRRLDSGTGLYYYRSRYYSAALGAFLQTDPIGYRGGINLYSYVMGDPLNFSDPFGLEPYVYRITVYGSSWRRTWRLQQELKRRANQLSTTNIIIAGSFYGEWVIGGGRRKAAVAALGAVAATVAIIAQSTSNGDDEDNTKPPPPPPIPDTQGTPDPDEDPNHLNHIFGRQKHGLDGLVKTFGSQQNAFRAIKAATVSRLVAAGQTSGQFAVIVEVGGVLIRVTGVVIRGVVRIGTAYAI